MVCGSGEDGGQTTAVKRGSGFSSETERGREWVAVEYWYWRQPVASL